MYMKLKSKIITILSLIFVSLFALQGCTVTTGYIGGNTTQYVNNLNITYSSGAVYGSLVEMLDATRPSVYEVYGQQTGNKSVSCGSGTVYGSYVNESGKTCYTLITCQHVLEDTDNYLIKDIYGNSFQTFLIGGDKESDIAVIVFVPEDNGYVKTENEHEYEKGGKTLKIVVAPVRNVEGTGENVKPLKVGESVYAIGNPLGTLGGTVTQGIISATDREIQINGFKNPMYLIQTDCAINGGNSGGGLFDNSGSLVGVVNAGYSGSVEGLNFAIPVNTAFKYANELYTTYSATNYGYVEGRAKIAVNYGLNLFDGNDLSIYDYAVSMLSTTVAVSNVGKHYYECGLRPYDVIISVKVGSNSVFTVPNRYDINGNSPVALLVNYLDEAEVEIGDEIVFKVARQGESDYINVTVNVEQYIYRNKQNKLPIMLG